MALDVIAAQSISVDIRGTSSPNWLAGPDQGDSNGQCPGGLESYDVVVFGLSAEWVHVGPPVVERRHWHSEETAAVALCGFVVAG
jgi:hypothetical protein